MGSKVSIEAHMRAFQSLEGRFAGSAQERAALDAVRARLPDPDAARIEGFAGHTAPWVVLGMHGVAAFVSGLLGFWMPKLGAAGCLLTSASLIGEGTGSLGLLRMWIPKHPSYNLVVPRRVEGARGTVVLTTPLDAPRVHVRRPRWLRRPLRGVLSSTLVLAALLLLRSLSEPWGAPLMSLYVAGLAGSAITAATVFLTWRSPRTEPADVGGMAALLQAHERLSAEAPDELEVWTVFTGCGRAHQDGVRAFLSLRGERLPQPLLVISLQDAGRAPLRAAITEGPLWQQHHRATGPALVERLQWAGVRVPTIDRPEASDATAASLLGYRALSLVGGGGPPDAEAATRAATLLELIVRWFGEDLARVEASRLPKDGSVVRLTRPSVEEEAPQAPDEG